MPCRSGPRVEAPAANQHTPEILDIESHPTSVRDRAGLAVVLMQNSKAAGPVIDHDDDRTLTRRSHAGAPSESCREAGTGPGPSRFRLSVVSARNLAP